MLDITESPNHVIAKPTRSEFGNRLREDRERLGLSIRDVCDHLQCTRAAVSAWECGEHWPYTKTLVRMAVELDYDLVFLFSGKRLLTNGD